MKLNGYGQPGRVTSGFGLNDWRGAGAGDLMVRLMADFAFAPVIINPPSHAWLVHIIIYTATAASKGRCKYDVRRVRSKGTRKQPKAFEVAWTY